MSNVVTAVEKASAKSKRKGKWANKLEILTKITGKHPDNIGAELARLVKKKSIEKKRGYYLWRPNEMGLLGGVLGASMSGATRVGIEGSVRTGAQGAIHNLLM